MKILLDTNAYSKFMNGDHSIFNCIVESEIVYMSTVVIGELYAGFIGGKKCTENVTDLKRFLLKEDVKIINVTVETAEIFGEIKSELSKKGKMIPLNDIWIAAHAIETGSKIVTSDQHIQNIKGIRLLE
jgi:tRNA(fMet)-specific endonuclease VapC